MTSSKQRNIEDLILKSNKIFFGVLSLFYLNQEKCAFFKIAFQAQINVQFVGLDFRSPGKFISGSLESVQYFFLFFFRAKKNGTDYGPYSARTPPGRGLYKPGQASPKAQLPRNPSRAQPQPRRRRRQPLPPPPPPRRQSAGAAHRPRFAAPRNVCRFLKKKFVRRFSFSSDISAVIF